MDGQGLGLGSLYVKLREAIEPFKGKTVGESIDGIRVALEAVIMGHFKPKVLNFSVEPDPDDPLKVIVKVQPNSTMKDLEIELAVGETDTQAFLKDIPTLGKMLSGTAVCGAGVVGPKFAMVIETAQKAKINVKTLMEVMNSVEMNPEDLTQELLDNFVKVVLKDHPEAFQDNQGSGESVMCEKPLSSGQSRRSENEVELSVIAKQITTAIHRFHEATNAGLSYSKDDLDKLADMTAEDVSLDQAAAFFSVCMDVTKKALKREAADKSTIDLD